MTAISTLLTGGRGTQRPGPREMDYGLPANVYPRLSHDEAGTTGGARRPVASQLWRQMTRGERLEAAHAAFAKFHALPRPSDAWLLARIDEEMAEEARLEAGAAADLERWDATYLAELED